ncbi:hypothetical protein [Sinorhizobium sp. RAC02]|uniref:DUF6950 family protein n=1 Tax=Sinorhizobium sp. RAC02 TaxID=1842534 RepID=UPI00083E1D61|nr:hypothetical protein [Sinorhizobium sp. RAC02]AOF91407.1 hypothetical protein BSY16_16 [Sinorhizobium sp. RAC02]
MAGDLTPDAVMEAVERIMSVRSEWGSTDCCFAACDVFADLHGIDPMAPVRGSYVDVIGAARLLKNYGGFASMAVALAGAAGLIVSDGRTGDIGLSSAGVGMGPERRCLLICAKPGVWAGKTELGYGIIRNAERSWRA